MQQYYAQYSNIIQALFSNNIKTRTLHNVAILYNIFTMHYTVYSNIILTSRRDSIILILCTMQQHNTSTMQQHNNTYNIIILVTYTNIIILARCMQQHSASSMRQQHNSSTMRINNLKPPLCSNNKIPPATT